MEFLPAEGRFWGLETAALEQKVREEMGPWHKVLSTGPAGENLVPFACLSTDQYHKAGRGGAGAVMGSKNLKAVVVRGTGAVTVGDARAFLAEMYCPPDRAHPHRRQRLDVGGGHTVSRRAGERGRRPADAQLALGPVRGGRGHPVRRAAARAHQDPRLHAVPARLPAGAPVRRARLRGAGVRDPRPVRLQLRHRRSRHHRRLQPRLRRAGAGHHVDRRRRGSRDGPVRARASPTTASPSATRPATSRRRG